MQNKKTVLYNYHKYLGAKFVPFAGYEMPVQYSSGIVDEHKITRSRAGLFDVSHMGQLSIEGGENLATELEKIIPTDLKIRSSIFLGVVFVIISLSSSLSSFNN